MSLTVSLLLNGQEIGRATVSNISDLAPVSDYVVQASTGASAFSGATRYHEFNVFQHNRRQTAWALAERVCAEIAARECPPPLAGEPS
jgi:hypothetical protein